MYRHLPKQVTRQFGYLQGIPRTPTVVALPIVLRIYVNEIFVECLDPQISEDVRNVLAPNGCLKCHLLHDTDV